MFHCLDMHLPVLAAYRITYPFTILEYTDNLQRGLGRSAVSNSAILTVSKNRTATFAFTASCHLTGGYLESGVAIFLYGLLCVLVYQMRYCRGNKTQRPGRGDGPDQSKIDTSP